MRSANRGLANASAKLRERTFANQACGAGVEIVHFLYGT